MQRLRFFLSKKRAWFRSLPKWVRITSYVVGVFIILSILTGGEKIEEEKIIATRQTIEKTVYATGNVVSATDIDLTFEVGGTVSEILVAEGETVTVGQPIIRLDQAKLLSELNQARADLAREQSAASQTNTSNKSEAEIAQLELDAARRSLQETKDTYDTIVENTLRSLLSVDLEAIPEDGDADSEAPTITGTYTDTKEGYYRVDVYRSNYESGASFRVSGLETEALGTVTVNNPSLMGTRGLYIQFPENFDNDEDWIIDVPNTRSATYTTRLGAYTEAIRSRDLEVKAKEDALKQAEANLILVQSETGATAVSSAASRVFAAQSIVAQKQAQLDGAIILAPANGVVTNIIPVIGEGVSAFEPVARLEDVGLLQLEVNVNEKDIIFVEVGQDVRVTFDAFGDKVFNARVIEISPTATIKEGVVRYGVTAQLTTEVPQLRPGMTANLTIITGVRENALVIPKRALFTVDNVLGVYKHIRRDRSVWQPVDTGFQGDGGLTEIVTGLSEEDTVVVKGE